MKYWKITAGAKHPDVCLDLHSPNPGLFSAVVKWDGCVHLNKYWNGATKEDDDEDNTDYIHICDIDDMIERLQEIKAIAAEYKKEHPAFDGAW